MGVPAFFKWLLRRYSQNVLLMDAIEEGKVLGSDMRPLPTDISGRNPVGIEFDNLYIDMNGIIHPCCHPEEGLAPATEDEMIANVLALVERLVAIVRPRKILYLAIDGVAPRAKMNQQRARRYFSAKEREFSKVVEERVIREQTEAGEAPSRPRIHWDHNQITPGTEFMERVASAVQHFVCRKLDEDRGWSAIKVLISDSNTPGEGEHKVMDFIRRQRVQIGYNPNTSHVVCGLDADLIMLGLATHEPHFFILREEIVRLREKTVEQRAKEDNRSDSATSPEDYVFMKRPYQYLRLSGLREYLQLEFGGLVHKMQGFKYEFERIIDDFIFLCFFAGNDFLPNLPSLSVHDGGIGTLMDIYKNLLPSLGGYLTDTGLINMQRVQLIISAVAQSESFVFRKRKMNEDRFKEREERKRLHELEQEARKKGHWSPVVAANESNINAAEGLRNMLSKKRKTEVISEPESQEGQKYRKTEEGSVGGRADNEGEMTFLDKQVFANPCFKRVDRAELSKEGYKRRWYVTKFRKKDPDHHFIQSVVKHYLEGLSWVLIYYYRGCNSWSWFYPFHYAPLASDFINIGNITLDIGRFLSTEVGHDEPAKPLEQLVSVLPPESAFCIPDAYNKLMSLEKLAPYFPSDFYVDTEGVRFAWQSVILLPFIDKTVLDSIIVENGAEENLTPKERFRNSRRRCLLLVSRRNTNCEIGILDEVSTSASQGSEKPLKKHLLPQRNDGLGGILWTPVERMGMPIPANVVAVDYEHPDFSQNHEWVSCLHPHGTLPPSLIPIEVYERKFGFVRNAGAPHGMQQGAAFPRNGYGQYRR